jgi:branched-chain amino acid transport system ATP-binding protein
MPASALEAIDVSVEFAGVRALDRVSLRLEPGEILGLIGPNGSGKTTLVNVLTGQLTPVAGRVVCNGDDITGLPPRKVAGRGIARSFQIVRLFRNLTVAENVEAGAIARGLGRPAARRVAAALLGEFGLTALADEFAGRLSYGDERRVEIARALAAAPRYLLLDPASARAARGSAQGAGPRAPDHRPRHAADHAAVPPPARPGVGPDHRPGRRRERPALARGHRRLSRHRGERCLR